MTTPPLEVPRSQVVAFRRRVGALDERLPPGSRSLRRAAWAGLQDSVPRAALLSIHARVAGTTASAWEDPALVQLWGPRHAAYAVPARDLPLFSLGRLPENARRHAEAQELADRLHHLLGGRRMTYGEAGRALGVDPNRLRYAAPTGRVLIRWDGARLPVVRTVPAPDADPWEARLGLARRYLHVFGPTTAEAFARWAGISRQGAARAFEVLRPSLVAVRTPVGDAEILAADEPALRWPPGATSPARLLPSGDAFFLLHGADRELLVPDATRRNALWTSRVWPGAVLVGGDVVGTWRRARGVVTVESWRRLSLAERDAVEAEAAALPLPNLAGGIVVRWADA